VTRLLIIGGSDAGISAALRAREVAPDAHVTAVVADSYPNFSICGLPFYLSGEVADWHDLAHRTTEDLERQGIELLLNTRAEAIEATARQVRATALRSARADLVLPYDRLVIATGAAPARPPIPGLNLAGVFPLHTMEDSFRLRAFLEEQCPRSAVIIGAGYIGVEMADALTQRGIYVTLMQHGPSVLATIDPSLGALVGDEARRHGVTVVTGVRAESIEHTGGHLVVSGRQQESTPDAHDTSHAADFVGAHVVRAHADLVLVAAGVRPETGLARSAGVTTGGQETRGAITVTRTMQTNVEGIYAAGDCIETWHRILERSTYLPLGTTAHKQGRIAGENAALDLAENRTKTGVGRVGGETYRQPFAGTVGTQVVKVFDVVVARTGLLESEARAAGFDPFTVESSSPDHKRYYPGASDLHLSITGDRLNGRLLGAQIVGQWHAEVAKRIDIFATALFHATRVTDLSALDLSYTPPVSSPWDPVQMAAQSWASHWDAMRAQSARE
jgi:NADPH-dependent 2,4-dienoyl-CoA reductase/sulfur reductase-like enzyme